MLFPRRMCCECSEQMAQVLSGETFGSDHHTIAATSSPSSLQSLQASHCMKKCTGIAFPRTRFQSRLQNQDWKVTQKSFPKHLEGHAVIIKSGFYHRRGSSRSNRFHHGTWKFSLLPESTTETKVSEEEESSTMDDSKNLEESSLLTDIDNTNDHTSTSVEDLLPQLDAVVVEAAERVAETVEVAVQTVSSVGEIEGPMPVEQPVIDEAMAAKTVAFWVCAAISFGLIIGLKEGAGKASEYFTGYIVEQSLSVDNLVVFVVIFKYFCVPPPNQSRVLTYGISGAVVFRATMILLGSATIQSFEAVNLLFASILIFSSYKLLTEEEEEKDLSRNNIVNFCRRFIPVTDQYDGSKFFTKMDGPLKATPLFLTLAVVELSDIAFAVDSIPAVFGVTRDPLIVFSSNIFAILGLRSLYTLISRRMDELDYLQPAVAVVLSFIGSKMIADFFGFHTSVEVSLGVVISVLGIGIGLSLWKNKQDNLK